MTSATFVFRAIKSGMVSFYDVKNGVCTLADLVGINHYLDMVGDIEYWANEESRHKMRSRRR